MPHRLRAFALPFAVGSLSIVAACGDDGRPRGETCAEAGECESGFCYEGICLDPASDDDGDGLSVAIEAALGTNPKNDDSDGDGKSDPDEVGPDRDHPKNADGDAIPDALESALHDADNDCIADELDPDDAVQDPTGCGNPSTAWTVTMTPNMDVSACYGSPMQWQSQNIVVEDGAFDDVWAPQQPNTLEIYGTMSTGSFHADLACVNDPDGSHVGTFEATGDGSVYNGSWSFDGRTGTIRVQPAASSPTP